VARLFLNLFFTLRVRVILVTLVLPLLFSCSLFNRSSEVGKEGEAQTVETVPKVQYDQLMTKYEKLLKVVREKESDGEVVVDAEAESGVENKKYPPSDKLSALKDDLVNSNGVALNDTVDVFSDGSGANQKIAPAANLDSLTVETQIVQLRKALKLVEQKKFNQAIGYLKDLENSSVLQIKVRAKYQVGEMLFFQQEYDLAMQVYEDIIANYAFSGVVLKTLGRLIECSNKLKLGKKQEQYYSVLMKFFEAS